MLNRNYYLEILDELKDRFIYFSEVGEKLILGLQDEALYKVSVNELFRIVHTIKALLHYADLKDMLKAFKALEDVLSILRNKKPPITQEIVDWLLLLNDTFKFWSDCIEQDKLDDVEPIDSYTLNMIKAASVSSQKPSEILKNLTIVLIETEDNVREGIIKLLSKKVGKIFSAKNATDIGEILSKVKPDILITSTQIYGKNFEAFILKVQEKFVNIPILFLSNKVTLEKDKKFKFGCFDCYVEKPLEMVLLEKKILKIAKTYYDSKDIKLSKNDLDKCINLLKPLPDIVFKLQEVLADKECGSREVANVIVQDPILTTKILRVINSPLYGFKKEIASIQQAVSLLGKDIATSICLQTTMHNNLTIDMSAYGITNDTFYTVSKKRMDLAINWFSKVSFSKLPILSTSALIGNLGQVLISQEINARKQTKDFLNLVRQTNPMAAEVEFLKTTSYDITADILAHWHINPLLVDAVRFTYDFTEAENETKQYAIANYVVFNTINSISSEIDLSIVEDMCEFLEEMNFDPKPYRMAVEKLLKD
ncbi:MAG: HDOD domain-containing protein [Campylobacterales bacterium]|nr:HDOD domain-containing protein [Campylobacterales bacterium]